MPFSLTPVYTALYAAYGDAKWWPADTPYEVIAGAVLTQNTAWGNVEKALAGFGGRLSPEFVEEIPAAELADIIRPAGFYNQKAAYLKAVTAWFRKYDYSAENAAEQPLSALRPELLAVKGVGRETADSILLYALGLPSFVVDAYTKRLLTRLGLPEIKTRPDYESVRAFFESGLERDVYLYNNFHALIVVNAKRHCRARPLCGGCPLSDICPACLM